MRILNDQNVFILKNDKTSILVIIQFNREVTQLFDN